MFIPIMFLLDVCDFLVKKRVFLLLLLGFSAAFHVWAGGKKDNESYIAEDPSGFSNTIDTSARVEKQKQKYNFFMEARDKGGNTTVAGPYNIYLDPESDLPVVTIINPRENMHIQGNLNIVGTCVDDDAVSMVEVWFNDDESTRVEADGTDFWLSDYETADLPDSVYSISVRGIDRNGLAGRVKRVEWHLDRKKPEITISSHESGSLVSGKIAVKGSVWDGNGIEALSYSFDNGEHYQPLKIKLNKQTGRYDFDVVIDTTVFTDGSTVILFKGRDLMKSEGVLSFLLFVNNTPPDVNIVYPAADMAVNGIFTVAGYAMHSVGIASLTWTLGKESGEFPLIVGNPWWVKEFDIRGQNVKNLDMEIRAVDLSGNVTVAKRRLIVDQEADMPRITLSEPAVGGMFSEKGLMVSGYAGDDEGIEAVLYSLNGRPPEEIPSTGYFQFMIPPESTIGDCNLEIWARDITGVEGHKTPVKGLVSPGPRPELAVVSVSTGEDFHSGMEINSEAGISLNVVIRSGSPLKSISYQLGSQAPVQLSPRGAGKGAGSGEYTQSIPVSPDSDYGLVQLKCTVIDIHNRETTLEDYLFITDLSARPVLVGHDSSDKLRDGPLSLNGFNGQPYWVKQISVAYGEKKPLAIAGSIEAGMAVSSAVFTVPGRPAIKASIKDGVIQGGLPPDLPLGLNSVTLTVNLKSGETYTVTGEFWILRPVEGRQVHTEESFTFLTPPNEARPNAVLDDGRILLLSGETIRGLYMFNGRPLKTVEVSGESSDSFNVRLDENGLVLIECSRTGTYGPLTFTLTNVDDRVFTTDAGFLVLNEYPDLSVTGPENPWVQNAVDIQLHSTDAAWLKTLEYSTDMGAAWKELVPASELSLLNGGDSPYTSTLDLYGLADSGINISIKAVDIAGRENIKTISITKDTEAPAVSLIVPISGAGVNGKIRLGMEIREAGRITSITYERPGSTEEGNERAPISRQVYTYSGTANDMPMRFLDLVLDPMEMPLDDNMRFVFTDMVGNTSTLSDWSFVINEEMDLPIVQISLPIEDEVIISDFVLSGVCYDDDDVKYLHWRIDDEEEQVLEITHGYTIPIALSSMRDNEHTVSLYVEDIYGVKGRPETRKFRVSLEEPWGIVLAPGLGEIVGGTVEISGVSSDRNGIKKVQVSLDNGNTFNDTEYTLDWIYRLNTRILKDGPNIMFIRVFDEYDISAMYVSMLIVDNTPPELSLDTPIDGVSTNGILSIAGNSRDNIMMESIQVKLSSLEGVEVPDELAYREIPVGTLVLEQLDLSTLPGGAYNVEIWATDKAQNITQLSRNITLNQEAQLNFVDILYPLNGEYVQGTFNLYGYVSGVDTAKEVTLNFNGVSSRTEPVTDAGYFRFSIDEANMIPGANTLTVSSYFGGKQMVQSPVRTIHYDKCGPWVTVDTMTLGDFAYERPWMMGRAGYILTEEDKAILADKTIDKEQRAAIEAKRMESVELSFDNGYTFIPVKKAKAKGYDWQYRIEDGDMREGVHYMIVRASMANGEKAVTRLLVQIDKTPPSIRLFTPEGDGRYNNELTFAALANDDTELSELTYYLRKGDKAAYEVPGFIQGLYFEGIIPPFIKQISNDAPAIFAGGATYTDFGMGLSFFDDNVKLQLQYGFMTQELFTSLGGIRDLRYGGHVLGLKLLANLYTLPFRSLFGPDWEWLSAALSVGANFSLFDVAREGYTQSGNPTWMSALLTQVEFPKVTIPKRKFLRTFSMFTEAQLWFVPTDVDAAAHGISTIIPHVIVGLRLYVF